MSEVCKRRAKRMASRARWLFLLYLSTVYVVAQETRPTLFFHG